MGKKLFLIFIGILIPFSITFALEIDWPPSPLDTDLTDASTLTDLVRYLYEWGIALGGLAAFIALLIAGFLYLTSVGDPQKLADARGRIIWALAGLVLLLAAWLILNTINPDLTTLSVLEFNLEDMPSFLCDDKCAQYKDKSPCVGDTDCSWNPLGKYCYNTKCAIYVASATCEADVDCAWDSSNSYCYLEKGCTKGFVCAKDPFPGDGKKGGVCVSPPLNEGPVCDYALVWNDKDWTMTSSPNVTQSGYLMPDDPAMVPQKIVEIGNPQPISIEAIYDDKELDALCFNASSSPITCASVTVDSTGNPCSSERPRPGQCCVWTEDFRDLNLFGLGGPLPNKCYRACKGSSCGCSVQVFVGGFFGGLASCGNIRSIIPAYERNTLNDIEAETISCAKLQRPFSY